nr:classical arabinogalactan protein 9-like [Ipomoea trifida]
MPIFRPTEIIIPNKTRLTRLRDYNIPAAAPKALAVGVAAAANPPAPAAPANPPAPVVAAAANPPPAEAKLENPPPTAETPPNPPPKLPPELLLIKLVPKPLADAEPLAASPAPNCLDCPKAPRTDPKACCPDPIWAVKPPEKLPRLGGCGGCSDGKLKDAGLNSSPLGAVIVKAELVGVGVLLDNEFAECPFIDDDDDWTKNPTGDLDVPIDDSGCEVKASVLGVPFGREELAFKMDENLSDVSSPDEVGVFAPGEEVEDIDGKLTFAGEGEPNNAVDIDGKLNFETDGELNDEVDSDEKSAFEGRLNAGSVTVAGEKEKPELVFNSVGINPLAIGFPRPSAHWEEVGLLLDSFSEMSANPGLFPVKLLITAIIELEKNNREDSFMEARLTSAFELLKREDITRSKESRRLLAVSGSELFAASVCFLKDCSLAAKETDLSLFNGVLKTISLAGVLFERLPESCSATASCAFTVSRKLCKDWTFLQCK